MRQFLFVMCLLATLFGCLSLSAMQPRPSMDGFYPRQDFSAIVQANREQCLGITFSEGMVLINLYDVDGLNVDTLIDQRGHIQTRYTIRPGMAETFNRYESCIAPFVESTKRPMKLNGARAWPSSDGSLLIGTFNLNAAVPWEDSSFMMSISPMSQLDEYRKTRCDRQRERRPLGKRGKEHVKLEKKEHKPTQDELNAIAKKQQDERDDKLQRLEARFTSITNAKGSIPVLSSLFDDEETKKVYVSLVFGVNLLKTTRTNAEGFRAVCDSVKRNLEVLEAKIAHARMHHGRTASSSLTDLFNGDPESGSSLTREIKSASNALIEMQERKEAARLKRHNADPAGRQVEELGEDEDDDTGEESQIYRFINPVVHDVISALANASNERSSYSGIHITRRQLRGLVDALKNAEAAEREWNDANRLGYYYSKTRGNGSHAMVRLGKGCGPIVLSNKGKNLTFEQMMDVRKALVEKGLLL